MSCAFVLKMYAHYAHRRGSFAYGPCLQFPEKIPFFFREESLTLAHLGITVRNGSLNTVARSKPYGYFVKVFGADCKYL